MTGWARLSVRGVLALHALLASGAAALLALLLIWPGLRSAAVGQRASDAALLARSLVAELGARCASSPDRGACEEGVLRETAARGYQARFEGAGSRAPPGRVRGQAGAPGGRTLVVELDAADATQRAARISRLATGFVVAESIFLFLLLYAVLVRLVARPAERLLAGLDRVGSGETAFGDAAPALGQVGTAFDRMERRLDEERRRVAQQVDELRQVNRQLSEARDTVLRQEKLATVGRLSAGVAHEVGNPLAAILGYLDVLRPRAGSDPTLLEYVDRLERETRRIDRIVRDLLDFSRPSRGPSGPVAVQGAVERTLRLLSTQRRFGDVRVDTSGIAPDLPAVDADEHYLQQVLLNLLVNAADAMKGKGTVRISAQLAALDHPARRAGDAPPGPRVAITVEDEGPGIPAADLPRVFDPFFTTKEPGEGTGLGLSICHSLVESFGGSISVDSAQGSGARFRIELPVAARGSMGETWPSAAS